MMAQSNERDAVSSIAARDAQLGCALDVALNHVEQPAGMGAMLGALETLREDPTDDYLIEMAETVLWGLVHRNPQARDDARRWHAQRRNCNPDEDAIAILDLERQVRLARDLYRRTDPHFPLLVGPLESPTYPTIPIGAEAIDAFRSEYLVPRFGETLACAEALTEWFDRLDQPKSSGGLTVAGVVARIIHTGRLLGTQHDDLDRTLQRVVRALDHHAKPLK